MPFGSLWLPVIVSAVVVFVASSIVHMALKYHKADVRPIPNEDAVRDAIAKGDPAPGVYMTPYCSDHAQLKDPAMQARFEKGPVAMLTVMPKGPVMLPKHLIQWFAFTLLVSFTVAYVARHTLHPGESGLLVTRITGAVAFTAYALAPVTDSIWKGQPWGNTLRGALDGVIYSVLTGLTFCFLWPAA